MRFVAGFCPDPLKELPRPVSLIKGEGGRTEGRVQRKGEEGNGKDPKYLRCVDAPQR